MLENFSRLKIGLALGGGAARGVVHLGVLQALEKENIKIDYIAGNSIGSAIGGLYALEPDAKEVTGKFISFLKSDNFRVAKMDFLSSENGEQKGFGGAWDKVSRTFRKSIFYGISLANVSFLDEGVLQNNLDGLIPDLEFQDCKIPFSCGATDLIGKRIIYFEKGFLRPAILASCSIPGIFPPLKKNGMILIDGSWAVQNPVRRVRQMGADFVIAVDVMLEDSSEPDLGNSFEVLVGGGVVTRHMLAKMQLEEADAVISPDTRDLHWADFSKAISCIRRGIKEAERVMPDIRSSIRKAKLRKLLTGVGSVKHEVGGKFYGRRQTDRR